MNSAHSRFARVYEEQIWAVYGFLAYRVSDRATAEDLTQATFERALRAWPRFDPQRASEKTWLLAIARNLLIDHARADRHVLMDTIDELALATVPGPEARAGGSPELLAALEALAPRDREIIALRFGGDLTGREIAELLGLSIANVQQIISRTLRKLRDSLDGSPQPCPIARRLPGASRPA